LNPILTYLKDIFAFNRIVGKDKHLHGLAKVDDLLQQLIASKKIPGLSISVLKNGNTIFQNGYGYADISKKTLINPENTVFRVASVSKPIAATALAYMVADGTVDLEASFYKYVPYYPKKKWDFTIRQLASHTAGIRGYLGKEYGLNEPYSIKESISIFKDDDLLFEPGTSYHYNSYDWVLISLAMQEASGILFEDYVKQKVLLPLKLDNTYPATLNGKDCIENNTLKLTTFYSKCPIGFRKSISVNNYYKLAGGGYLSTSSDIVKLGQAYLDKQILNDEVLNQFLTSQVINNTPTYYGLGWQVSHDKKQRSFYGHIGNGVGGYSNFFVYPDQKMVVSILVNCTNPDIQNKLDEVIDVLISLD
tara:strand:- start:106734 stop:107822 length:1089 start_codon:yes stop_codon:yes gene_type:complete